MALIIWNNDMSVGVPSIDEQHKRLVGMINKLYDATTEGRGGEEIGHTLDGLVGYVAEHFAYEENYFKETNYPDAEAHIKEHQALTKQVVECVARYKQNQKGVLVDETLQFLVKWLMDHTLGCDKLYSDHLVNAGIK